MASDNTTHRPRYELATPVLLKTLKRWIPWALRRDARSGRTTKKPLRSQKNSGEWATFSDAMRFEMGATDCGLGLVLTDRVPIDDKWLIVLDLDSCRHPDTGVIEPWAREVVEHFDSYTELSPSGHGLHILALVDREPQPLSKIAITANPTKPGKAPEIQVFGTGAASFVTFTGAPIEDKRQIRSVGDGLGWFRDRYGAAFAERVGVEQLPTGQGPSPTVDEIAAALDGVPKMAGLIEGDWRRAGFKDSSDGYFELVRAVLSAARNHGEAAVEFLLHHTAFGAGEVDSPHANKYTRPDWVEKDVARTARKARRDLSSAFGNIDAAEWQPPLSTNVERQDARHEAGRAAIASRWQTIDRAALDRPPTEREYVVLLPNGQGWLPLGIVGIFAAPHGVGKTLVLIALAICKIVGRKWLGVFPVNPDVSGDVLLVVAEEDVEEVTRRVVRLCRAMELTDTEKDAVSEHLVVVPLAGKAVCLVETDRQGATRETEAMKELRRRIDDHPRPWALIVVDPIARVDASGAERDNQSATRFITMFETFTQAHGRPSVLLSQHSSKEAIKQGKSDVRGVGGLEAAPRWSALMHELERDPEVVQLVFGKNNYGRRRKDVVVLRRDDTGLLWVETDEQRKARESAKREAKVDKALDRDSTAETVDDARYNKRRAEIRRVLGEVYPEGLQKARLLSEMNGAHAKKTEFVRRAESEGLVEIDAPAGKAHTVRLTAEGFAEFEREGILG